MSKTVTYKLNPNSLKNLKNGVRFKSGYTPWNKGKGKTVTFVCEMCEKEVTKPDKGDGRSNRFCSLSCSAKNLQKPEILKKRALSTVGTKRTEEQKEAIRGDKAKQWKGGAERFKCIDCEKTLSNCNAKRCVDCKGVNQRGENSVHWKGGVTPENHAIRTSKEYKLWRTAVFERDNHTCVWCNARSEKGKPVVLNADHIKPFALYPELRLAIDNGRTLCVPCHKKTDTFGGLTRKTT